MKKWLALIGIFTFGFVSHLYLVNVFKPDIKPTYSVSTISGKAPGDVHAFEVEHASVDEHSLPVLDSSLFVGYLKLESIAYSGAGDPRNKAVIKDLLTSQQKDYSLNSALPYGGEITQILKDRVVIKRKGRARSLELLESSDDSESRKFLLANGYKKIAPNEWLLMPDHLHLDKHVENSLLSTEISPHPIKGVQRFRIDNFPEGGVLEKLGFKLGDSIITIDGEQLTDIQHILRICWKIRNSSLINVELERNHHPIHLSYRIVSDKGDV